MILRFFDDDVERVAPVEHDGAQHGIDLRMPPMFAQDVRWVDGPRDVVEFHHAGGHGFSHVVV